MLLRSIVLVLLAAHVLGRAEETISILPPAISLTGAEARQRVLAERMQDASALGVAESPEWSVADPAVAKIDGNVVTPVGPGQTTLSVRIGDQTATAPITVQGFDHPFAWSFRNHVQSILARSGCNSGACHGAAAGKKGFKLSLRGYDAEGDYDVLLRQTLGRRVNREEPAQSLMLTKATAAVPHGGGQRFDVDSREYHIIADWIAAGATSPAPDDPRIDHIEIVPARSRLAPKGTQPLIVLAYFSNGRVEDVTSWAKYTAASADVAEVDETGTVRVVGFGEGAISAWYLNKIALASVTVPYVSEVDPATFANESKRNLIDEEILAKLADLNLPPSAPATDWEFVRRVYIDMIGTLPTPAEVRAFLADTAPDKRDRLIEELFGRREFVDYWTYRISDLMLVNSERLKPPAMWAYYNWIRGNVASNRPWDEMTRDLITATGSTLENGATNFFVLHQDVRELTETMSVAFLGLSINCARCHNHPLERWTNDEYFGLANMLARVRLKGAPGEGNFTVFASREGDVTQPLRGRPQPPRPLDGTALPIESPDDRRVELARWVTSTENPYFAKAIVNRIWAAYMGVGIVEPVDDLRLTNPPTNPKLLSALADYLVEQKYDLRALMRLILQSNSYQRSSVARPENAGDRRFYSHYYPRRLMAEVLIDAVAQVTAVPTNFAGYPAGWRAIQLPDSKVASTFLDKFGRAKRDATCTCERTNSPSMVQTLHLSNGDTVNEKLRQAGSRPESLLAAELTPEALIAEAYLLTVARPPTDEESAALVAEWNALPAESRREWLEDLLWSLTSGKEFLFNH